MRSDEIPAISNVRLNVAGLGSVKGILLNNKICQYLGIPYAKIPGRFRRSVPANEPWKDGEWDGTKFGPYCPQPPRDFYPIPTPSRSWLEMPGPDEFECLNLNISVPCLPSDIQSPLPVMVFIHGGAFTYAMNSSPIYDGRMLASASVERLGKPTIIVNINYRLGVYGFLAGHEIQKYNKSHGEDGVGNYGIWDQILALRWVKKHVSAFGGDPDRITLFGQSAGAVSVHCHLLRNEALFSSAILQSGLIRLCGIMSVDEYQVIYEKLLQELNISTGVSTEEQLRQMLEIDSSKLTAAMIPVFITPVITMSLCDDKVLVPRPIATYDECTEFQVPDWCPRLILGDARNECIIWNKSWDSLSVTPMQPGQDLWMPTADLVLAKIDSYLGTKKAQQIAELYGLTSDSSVEDTFWALERLTTHGLYSSIIYFAQQAARSSVFAYHFDVPSPYENAWGRLAHHSNDNVLIWGLLRHILPPHQHKVADQMTEAWINFANGIEPWERLAEKDRRMVFDEGGATMRTEEDDDGRGYDIWKTLDRVGLVADLANLSKELCLRSSEVLNRKYTPTTLTEEGRIDAAMNCI